MTKSEKELWSKKGHKNSSANPFGVGFVSRTERNFKGNSEGDLKTLTEVTKLSETLFIHICYHTAFYLCITVPRFNVQVIFDFFLSL